jgi:cytochrome c553
MNRRVMMAVLATGAVMLWGSGRTAPAADAVPGACVDCHVKTAEADLRLSVLMAAMTRQVEAPLLARLQAAAPKGVKLKGKHPNVAALMKSIPDGCLKCHARTSKSIPALSQLLHVIHLAPGEENDRFAKAAGSCASCHKLNPATGAQVIPSGPEK